MQSSRINRLVARAHDFLRRHWQQALQFREKFILREEALHLAIAGVVGVLGLGEPCVFSRHRSGQTFPAQSGRPRGGCGNDGVERVSIPALGGLAAGMVLHWGLRGRRAAGFDELPGSRGGG
ncbi:MAG: hypothetical protein U1F83_14530 [Verrucomicrobiota bacterium]